MRIHHIGYVVKDIGRYSQSMPGLSLVKQVEDPVQRATLALYAAGTGCQIELIQPQDAQAYTWGHLQRAGEGMHHVCYEGLDAPAVDRMIAAHRMLKVLGPVHAVLFDRPVVFAVTRSRAILEFLL
ncbi:MAG TPA: VOC family protein [Roseomonas sp.]|jgi:catechol 2,3-dioxygenase-like lactoylglutathione lyase family enzyme